MSENSHINIKGARTHNLKNIDVSIPKNQITVISGLSGSGKSSLAFDTLYAEGQRRYVESLSAYARQFLGLMEKPDVDLIEGLSPAISIDQKSTGHNPRSTVGTVTEIYDYLRLLFARIGHPRSKVSGKRLEKQTIPQIVDRIINLQSVVKKDSIKAIILAPIIKNRKGTYEELFSKLQNQGFVRVRINDIMYNLDEEITLDKFKKYNIDLVIDRLIIDNSSQKDLDFLKRVTDSIELASKFGDGEILVNLLDLENAESLNLNIEKNNDIFFSEKLVDKETGESFTDLQPHSFSFNSPMGACPECSGIGNIKKINEKMIFNPRLSISEGGIFPIHRFVDSNDNYIMATLNEIAKLEKFSLKDKIGKIPEKVLSQILNGYSKEISITYKTYLGNVKKEKVKFEGIIPWMEKRYLESESDWVRGDVEQYMDEVLCPLCKGYRLKLESLSVTLGYQNIADITKFSIKDAFLWFENLENDQIKEKHSKTLMDIFNFDLSKSSDDSISIFEKEIGKQIFKEIKERLKFLLSVGLDYLTLDRKAKTLSGGESQRIRLASQIGTGLSGVLYVLDEPSIGLHQRDNARLLETLDRLKKLGNTVVVVEHDEDTILSSDYLIDIGPRAGIHGGEVVLTGKPKELIANSSKIDTSLTLDYISGKKVITKESISSEVYKLDIQIPNSKITTKDYTEIKISSILENNLKGFDIEIPLGKFVCITGVSGSGKSTLVNEVIFNALHSKIYRTIQKKFNFKSISGFENIDKLIKIDQSPIGRTPRSNPSTYVGVFDEIRNIFASTNEAKSRGYKTGRFSFNVKGGRCEKCEGAGVIQISMQFLPDVYITCDECKGQRYNRDTLQIDFKGKNIADILDMTIEEGYKFFQNIPKISTKLKTLSDVGLGYIKLGQGATTLSGGESQRVKLASELSKRQTGNTFYILDEPTTGLHFEDVRKLLVILHGLVKAGNTVLVIEHNLDVIKTSDWIIDLGPEGGQGGGNIVAIGTPEDIANTDGSYTGFWLKKSLKK